MKANVSKEWILDFAYRNNVRLSGVVGDLLCKVYGDKQTVCNRVKNYVYSRKNEPQKKLTRFAAAGVFARKIYNSIPFIKELWKEWYPYYSAHTEITGANYDAIRNGVPTKECVLIPAMKDEIRFKEVILNRDGLKVKFDGEVKGDTAAAVVLYNKKGGGRKRFEVLTYYGAGAGDEFIWNFGEEEKKILGCYERGVVFVVNIDDKGRGSQGSSYKRVSRIIMPERASNKERFDGEEIINRYPEPCRVFETERERGSPRRKAA